MGWNPWLLVRGGTEKVCARRLEFPEASGAERFATALWSSANQMCVYGCNKFNFGWNRLVTVARFGERPTVCGCDGVRS